MLNLLLSIVKHPQVLCVGMILGYLLPGNLPAILAFVKSKIHGK